MAYILPLDTPKAGIETVGGKCRSLSKLIPAILVGSGFESFQLFINVPLDLS